MCDAPNKKLPYSFQRFRLWRVHGDPTVAILEVSQKIEKSLSPVSIPNRGILTTRMPKPWTVRCLCRKQNDFSLCATSCFHPGSYSDAISEGYIIV